MHQCCIYTCQVPASSNDLLLGLWCAPVVWDFGCCKIVHLGLPSILLIHELHVEAPVHGFHSTVAKVSCSGSSKDST